MLPLLINKTTKKIVGRGGTIAIYSWTCLYNLWFNLGLLPKKFSEVGKQILMPGRVKENLFEIHSNVMTVSYIYVI